MRASVRAIGRAAVLALLGTALLVGCGDDDDGDSGAPAATKEPKGPPITIGNIGTYTGQVAIEESRVAAEAAVEAVNASGGVNGRPLKLLTCDERLNPGAAATCARKIAKDDSVVATVGNVSVLGEIVEPVLAKAGLPDVGPYPTSPIHYTSGNAYPIVGGIYGAYAGAAKVALERGHKKIAILYNELPTAPLLLAGIKDVLDRAGVKPVSEVSTPVTITDVSPAVAKINDSGADAVIIAYAEPLLSRFIQGFEQSGSDIAVITGSGDLDDEAVKALGPASEGLVGAGLTPPPTTEQDVAGIARFNEEMDQYGEDDTKRNAIAINSWLAVKLFADVAKGLDTVDRQSVMKALNELSGYETDGLTPTLDFTTKPEGQPRLFNASVVELEAEGGRYDYDGKFVDPFSS